MLLFFRDSYLQNLGDAVTTANRALVLSLCVLAHRSLPFLFIKFYRAPTVDALSFGDITNYQGAVMNKEQQEYLTQTIKDADGYVSGLGDMELERSSRKRPGKLESKLGNFREKIKKGHKPQSF